MDKELENINKAVKSIKLSPLERSSMRSFLLENLNSTPMEENKSVTNGEESRLYYYYKFFTNNYFMINNNKFVPTLAIALIIALSGGASAFAEKAVPGDLLYGVKTFVNEPVAGVFAFTKEEKTEWKERLVERRLDEAQKLVSRGGLSEVNRVNLENQIKVKIDEFNVNVNELALQKNQDINSSDLNIRLRASLAAYKNVLEALSAEPTLAVDTKVETDKFINALAEYNDKVKNDNKNLELNVGVARDAAVAQVAPDNSSALEKQTAAVSILNSTKLTYQKEKVNLSANIQNQIDGKLALAETTLEEGKVFLTASDFPNATLKFQAVISTVSGAKLLMFSNVIKGDIEDENELEDSGDIEDDHFEDIDENDDEDESSFDSESIKKNINDIKLNKLDLEDLEDIEED
ncbi:MAG: DUF5667 domain-containing protein [Candidatus Paceibacterota bacterium]|jgi:hypothetical protein